MKRIAQRVQSDPLGIAFAVVLLIAVIFEIFSPRSLLTQLLLGLGLGLVIGYNARLVADRRRP